MVGIGLLVYPDAADWFARLGHNAEISGYVERVEATPSAERRGILEAAYAYNDELEPGPLTDPYVAQHEDEALRSDVYLAYERMLRVSGTDTIGTLSYPRLDIGLPVYHGTADATISKGVGHLYGTSLPVGGPSTRSVLTAHSGLPQSQLFTRLPEAEVGDTFWISVLGEDHHYRVERTETVLPGETESLEIIEGEDWVTLFTCTPIGVNSHRFMVHAVRIADPQSDQQEAIGGDGIPPGFPWWAVWFAGGSAVVAWVLFAPPRKKRRAAAPEPGLSS
ncbi:class C sortase [Leucobacter weissii]|uniref:Class C sortase n=2 Tax=Leucobacter weissii TaxID=1983706 RepID=A0A939SBS0_9MICO|nr:class C sortase [Leucobacter weissii]MBO1901720.1 class C sortase [Leucobacter weissii]